MRENSNLAGKRQLCVCVSVCVRERSVCGHFEIGWGLRNSRNTHSAKQNMAAPSEKAAGRARDSVSAESEGGEAGGTSSLLRDAPSVRPAGAEAAGTKGGWDAVKDSVVG